MKSSIMVQNKELQLSVKDSILVISRENDMIIVRDLTYSDVHTNNIPVEAIEPLENIGYEVESAAWILKTLQDLHEKPISYLKLTEMVIQIFNSLPLIPLEIFEQTLDNIKIQDFRDICSNPKSLVDLDDAD